MRRDWGETICGTHAHPNVEIPSRSSYSQPGSQRPLSSHPRGIMEGWRDAKPRLLHTLLQTRTQLSGYLLVFEARVSWSERSARGVTGRGEGKIATSRFRFNMAAHRGNDI